MKTIAYCGLACESCPIHLATLEKDDSVKANMRIEIAEQLARIYKTTPKPEIITDCDGCKATGGRLFTGCIDCEIRKCAIVKQVINCAYCGEYACDKLRRHFAIDPGAQVRLEEILKNETDASSCN
jgi:Ni,Fe-hydrogenase III small subunit